MSTATSRKKQSGKHSTGSKGLMVIIILCFLGIMPLLIWISLPETSTYAVVTTSSAMIQSAAADTGLQICSQETMGVEVQGAETAILYQLAPDCSRATDENTIMIFVIGFDSTKTQMEAIGEAQETVGNWQMTNTTAFITGTNVIVMYGAPGNQVVEQISSSLIGQSAARIL